MKLLVDMNLSQAWVGFIAESGHEAYYWSTVGAFNSADRSILRYAASHDLIVLTRDLDFGHMLAIENHGKPSVIQIRSGYAGTELLGAAVLMVLQNSADELEQGALITLDRDTMRLRVLPFRRHE